MNGQVKTTTIDMTMEMEMEMTMEIKIKTNKKTVHFITGGAGIVGSSLILELLRQADTQVFCLVRASGGNISVRLRNILMATARIYDYEDDILEAICSRCHAVQGDIRQPNCGVTQPIPPIDQFWHCADALNCGNRYGEENAAHAAGTENALAFSKKLGVQTFNYISTAYGAGTSTAPILEEPVRYRENNHLYELGLGI